MAMAHLWEPVSCEADAAARAAGDWSCRPLDAGLQLGPSARLLRSTTPDGERWVVIDRPSLRVNGVAIAAGIAVLRDRDELCTGGRRLFFSTESLAAVASYPGSERPTSCPRCKLEIVAGSPAVACPQCGVWHHQSAELFCWTYVERCALCDQATSLDTGFRWTPEDL